MTNRVISLLTKPGPLLAAGLGIASAAGSLFLATVNRTITPADVAALSGLYFLLATVGTGVLAGLEQEMTRTVSRSLADGTSPGAAVRQQLRQAAGLAAATVALMGVTAPFIVHHWCAGHWYLYFELLVGLLGTWAAYLIRGLLSGYRDFRLYAVNLSVEGLSRLVPSLVIALLGVGSTWSFGLCYALGPGISAVVGIALFSRAHGHKLSSLSRPAARPADAAAVSSTRRAVSNLVYLTVATLASQVLMNGLPLAVVPRLASDAAVGAAVASAIGLTRLALLTLFPLQAPLLPKLTAAATLHKFGEVRRTTARLVGAVSGIGLVVTVGTAAIGPWVLTHVMGTKASLSAVFLGSLALGTMLLMVAFVLQSALIALNRHVIVFAAWTLGVVAMFVAFALPIGALAAGELASLIGPGAVIALELPDAILRTRRQPDAAGTPAAGDLSEQAPVAAQ